MHFNYFKCLSIVCSLLWYVHPHKDANVFLDLVHYFNVGNECGVLMKSSAREYNKNFEKHKKM